MRLLADTHVIIWSVQNSDRLTPTMRRHLAQADEVWVSAASVWEMRIKRDKGRLDLPAPPLALAQAFLEQPQNIFPIKPEHAAHVLPDPPDTKDPFDHLLLAQCEIEGLRLLTADVKLLGHRLTV